MKGLEVAYNRLAMTCNRVRTELDDRELERFVAEIQLYGTPRQIALMVQMVESFKRNDPLVSFNELGSRVAKHS